MDFAFSEEQETFRETLRRFFEEACPVSELFRQIERQEAAGAGGDPAPWRPLWRRMAGELGLAGIAVPEAYGGQGFSFLELGIALEEAGRVLAPGPLFASACVGASALLAAGREEQRAALLPAVAAGDCIATLALAEPGPDEDASGPARGEPKSRSAGASPELGSGAAAPDAWDPAAVRAAARRCGKGHVLEGEKTLVLEGAAADLFAVAARLEGAGGAPGSVELFAVRAGEPGVRVLPQASLDPTRRLARLVLEGAPGELLGEPGRGARALAHTLDHAAIGLAAEMAGGAARCLEMAVAYAVERRQFGRPIGMFQAIKHKAAEVLLEVESARSAAWWACWTAAEERPERGEAAALAKAACADAFLRAAGENIQIHGGVGFTWEAPPHLYYRRAKVSGALFGDPVGHRARLAARIGLGAEPVAAEPFAEATR